MDGRGVGSPLTFVGGLESDSRRRLVACRGRRGVIFPYRYLGADDQTGPNHTGQPAVDSYYEPLPRP